MTTKSFVLYLQHDRILADYRLTHIGSGAPYWDEDATRKSFLRRAGTLYWPLVRMLSTATKKHSQTLNLSLSLGGSFLELCQTHDPALFTALQKLLTLPNIGLVCTPRHGGALFGNSDAEFISNLQIQRKWLRELFNKDASIVHLPHLLYGDYTGKLMINAGFNGAIIDGWEPALPGELNANHVFHHPENPSFKILASNFSFTEDFNSYCERSSKNHFAVSAERYIAWLKKTGANPSTEVITSFLDLSGPGAENSDVLCFLSDVFNNLAESPTTKLVTADAAIRQPSRGAVRCTTIISNKLPTHDANHWIGSSLQQDFLEKTNSLTSRIRHHENHLLLDAWRNLFSTTNLSHMHIRHYTEDGSDLDHLPNPYDISLSLLNILEDLELALCKLEHGETPAVQFRHNGSNPSLMATN
jgi:hypothetical protein